MIRQILFATAFLLELTIPITDAQSQESLDSNYQADINESENALIGKFAEEVLRLEHGAVKSLKAEAIRDKKHLENRNRQTEEATHSIPSIESIEADLKEREAIAKELETHQ
jgi:hypothetical protein